jgi:hypothetical protein
MDRNGRSDSPPVMSLARLTRRWSKHSPTKRAPIFSCYQYGTFVGGGNNIKETHWRLVNGDGLLHHLDMYGPITLMRN